MANAKANIYPVQLQNTELNLNKYNAEIKQYTGFNKNNSPFVGGGLSPIFRKDEVLEGCSSKNTYIDNNGDVYKVTTEGLFKNDERVIRMDNMVTHYCLEKEKLDSTNVLQWYSDKFKLWTDGTKLFINDEQLCYLDSNLKTPDVLKYQVYAFFGKINNIDCFCILGRYTDSWNNNFNLLIFNASTKQVITSRVSSGARLTYSDYNIPLTCFYTDNSNQLSIIYTGRFTGATTPTKMIYTKFKINDDFSINVVGYNYPIENSASAFNLTVQSGLYPMSPYVYDFVLVGAPKNEIYSRRTIDDNTGNHKCTYFKVSTTLNTYDSGNSLIVAQGGNSFAESVINSSVNNQFLEEEYDDNYFSKYFISQLFQFEYSSGNYRTWHINCSDAITLSEKTINGVTKKRARSAGGYNYTLDDFRLLINNGVLTGISSKTYNILLTEWNTVEGSSIFVCPTDKNITVKEGEDFYVIRRVTATNDNVSLKKIGNQIIINLDTKYNSYDIKRNKKLTFAYGYNAYFSASQSTYTENDNNNYWVGVAINEYSLNDNASIILNPVNIFYKNNNFNLAPFVSSDYFVNIYTSEENNTECIYRYSNNGSIFSKYVRNELRGLPYPTDTNGNIQYSPSLFSNIQDSYGNTAMIKSGDTSYPLMKYNNEVVMSYYLASGVEGLEYSFIVQGQAYGIINKGLYSLRYNNGVIESVDFIVSVEGLKFCGNSPYQAFFFSRTNRCMYIFTGANVLQQSQFIDKFDDVKTYKYNPATQTIFMIVKDIVLIFSAFGLFTIDMPEVEELYLLNEGICVTDNEGNYRYIKYYKNVADTDYEKQNIELETCFYGANNQLVTINDCLYIRLFDEEHSSGNVVISATTLANEGKATETTTFPINAEDWDTETDSIYLRYQPRNQRGLGISFKINSPFKICSMSVSSTPDAVLIDRVSKKAINAPETSSNPNDLGF